MKVLELFAGIGACSKALENLGVECEIVDAVEIDKYAIRSFNAIHGTHFEPQDITQWDKDVEVDLITHGSPCQDFSVAGLQKGGDEGSGTRSSLMYETIRIVSKLRPKYVLWENVKNILSKKHVHNFHAYLGAMTQLGYKSEYEVFNAKDFGVPQNRERVFTVSIRRDIADEHGFNFPLVKLPVPKLSSVLESVVDEKYYMSDDKVAGMKLSCHKTESNNPSCEQVGELNMKGHDCIKRVYSPDGLSPTLTTMGGGNTEPKIVASRGRGEHNKQHIEPRKDGLTNTLTSVQKDNLVATIIDDTQGFDGVRTYDKYSPTLRSSRSGLKTVDSHLRVRKLTPRECWRLMGFSDEDFDKAATVNSNTQLYKQAGNSIVVNVVEAIFRNML